MMRGDESRRLGGDQGWVLMLTALLILPIMAFTSFAVDLGAWYARAAQLQRSADAASLAAAPLLPDTAKAKGAAFKTLVFNGICTSASVTTGTNPTCVVAKPSYTVTAAPVPGSTTYYQVNVTDASAPQYFSRLFRSSVSIGRKSTAERIKPVPMGSPRNYLGTRQEFGTGNGAPNYPENFRLAISGYCTRQEFGDRIATYADNNGADAAHQSCIPGTPAGVKANPEYSPNGYFYAVEFPATAAGAYKVQYRLMCPDFDGTMRVNFRDKGFADPLQAPITATVDLTKSSPCSDGSTYVDLATVTNPQAGDTYYIQIYPLPSPSSNVADQSHMMFALRVRQPGGFTRCTGDSTTANAQDVYSASCPKLYALQHLGIYADVGGANPTFYLASIGPEHAGKTMYVELFDPAEGANFIQLLDPNDVQQTFEAEIGCKDATYVSEAGACTTGEMAPTGGRGPWTGLTQIDVSGTGQMTWSPCSNRTPSSGTPPIGRPAGCMLTQNGKYSNRHVRLKVTLPANYGSVYGTKTWWKIRYVVSGSIGDRTTWTVRIKGDPVRLIPNP